MDIFSKKTVMVVSLIVIISGSVFARGASAATSAMRSGNAAIRTSQNFSNVIRASGRYANNLARLGWRYSSVSGNVARVTALHADDLARLGIRHGGNITRLGLREGDDIVRNFSNIKARSRQTLNTRGPQANLPTIENGILPNIPHRQLETPAGYATTIFSPTSTPNQHRISRVSSPELMINNTPRQGNLSITQMQNMGYNVPNQSRFQGGHILADSLGGSRHMDNIVPMTTRINQPGGEWFRMEEGLRSALQEGRRVTNFEVIVRYPSSNSMTPSRFRVSYEINGQRRRHVIRNI